MDDLQYIVNIGFAGTDVWRAITLAFIMGMYVSPTRSIWRMAFFALLIDRTIWPLTTQAMAGADPQSLWGSVTGLAETFVSDLGMYLVRYLGMALMIVAFVAVRHRIHSGFAKAED